jgi:short-subunit dehydrogenase
MKLINPKITFIKISDILRKINLKIFNLPFKIRALILPALVASDQKLINLGWKKKYNAKDTLRTIIKKENYLIDPIQYPPPSGITLITGASSGLGKEFLYKLARVRDKIIVIDKDIRPIKKFAKKFKDKIKLIKADLSNTESLDSLIFNGYLSKYKISEAFLCAGIAHKSKLLDTNYKIHEKIFKINFLSSLIIINKAYTDMNYLNYGNIVIINSSSSFQPLPHLLSYSASKVALKFLGQGMAIENENSNIKILNVYPGGMKTNFQRNSNVKIIKNEKLLSTTYVYTETMKALKNKKKNLIIGFNAKVMFYASKFIPELLLLKFFNILMKKLR